MNAQSNNQVLYSFYDEDTRLKGFKDSKDSIIYQAQYGFFSKAKIFERIVALNVHLQGEKKDAYYMLPSGKKFGRDSLYVFDFAFDCESEGFIRFQDPTTQLVGLFDSEGKVAISAEYNYLSSVKNGYIVGLKNAKKEFYHQGEGDCNHFKWVAGDTLLLKSDNTIVVQEYTDNYNLKWSSSMMTTEPSNDPIRVNYKTTEGKYLSFVDNLKEFDQFLEQILEELDSSTLESIVYNQIGFSSSEDQTSILKKEYLSKNGARLLKSLSSIHQSNYRSETSISNFLPRPIELSPHEEKVYDNCGRRNLSEYPIYTIRISKRNEKGRTMSQDHIQFLKLKGEIKLVSASLNND